MKCETYENMVVFSNDVTNIGHDLDFAIDTIETMDSVLQMRIDALSSRTLFESVLAPRDSGLLKALESGEGINSERTSVEFVNCAIGASGEMVAEYVDYRAVVSLYERAVDGEVQEPSLNEEAVKRYHAAIRESLSDLDMPELVYLSMAWISECRSWTDYVGAAHELWLNLFDGPTRTEIASVLNLDLCDVTARHVVLLFSTVIGEQAYSALTYPMEPYGKNDIQLRL